MWFSQLYEDNMSAINMINNHVPTKWSCYIDIQHFSIKDWANAKDIVMQHTPCILSIPDGLTKVLCCVKHSRNAPHMMDHFLNALFVDPILLI